MTEDQALQEYKNLSKVQKLAHLMVVVGPESAALLMKNFDDDMVEDICKEVTKIPIVEKPMQKIIIEDFSEVIGESLSASLGGYAFAEKALSISKGSFRANTLLNRIAPVSETLDVMKDIKEMDPQKIYSIIRGEQSQTIAFVIANLPPQKGASVLSMLPSDSQNKVIERIGSMESATLEQVNLVVDSLRKRLIQNEESPRIRTGGIQVAADILKGVSDKEERQSLLEKIEKTSPEIGAGIRKKMFEFDDLLALSAQDLQLVVKDVDKDVLVLALKTASSELKNAVMAAVSKRAAETLQEDLEFLGAKRKVDVENAQAEIIQLVKEMEEEGSIVLAEGDDVV